MIKAKIKGQEDGEEEVSSYWMIFTGNEGKLEIEKGSTRLHFVWNWLGKRIRTCR